MSDLILPNNPEFTAMGHLKDQYIPPADPIQIMTQVATQVATDVFEQLLTATLRVKYQVLTATAKAPTYANNSDTCADLYADEDVDIPPFSVGKISTGLAFEAPPGIYFRILPRSGMSSKGYIVTAGM